MDELQRPRYPPPGGGEGNGSLTPSHPALARQTYSDPIIAHTAAHTAPKAPPTNIIDTEKLIIHFVIDSPVSLSIKKKSSIKVSTPSTAKENQRDLATTTGVDDADASKETSAASTVHSEEAPRTPTSIASKSIGEFFHFFIHCFPKIKLTFYFLFFR